MLLRLVLAAILLPVSVNAQELRGGFSMTSETTLGWTSNVQGMAGGTGDVFVEHSHGVAFVQSGGTFALRGALSFDETRYWRLWQDNDRKITGELALQWQLSPQTLAQADIALTGLEEGQGLASAAGVIGAVTQSLKLAAGLGLRHSFGHSAIQLGLRYGGLWHGETVFGDVTLPTLRTRADQAMLGADIRFSQALSPYVVATALLAGQTQMISEADQMVYGRIPASTMRLALGGEIAVPLRASLALEAGADAVFVDLPDVDPLLLPYMRADAMLALGHGFDMRATLGTHLDFDTPADGLADWRIEGRTALGYALSPGARTELALFASALRSLGLDVEHRRTLGTEFSIKATLSEAIAARAGVSYALNEGLMPSYEETRLAFTLSAAL